MKCPLPLTIFRRWEFIAIFVLSCGTRHLWGENAPIDRHALVARHNPVLHTVDFSSPLSVGNGEFAFTCDITGLQTFAEEYYRKGMPVEAEARWAWQEEPNPHHYKLEDCDTVYKSAGGTTLSLPTNLSIPAAAWLRRNPHLQALAKIGLVFAPSDGQPFTSEKIEQPQQTLDLWRGTIVSHFRLEGVPVAIITVCHPELDLVAVRIESELVAQGRLGLNFDFPRDYDLATKNTPPVDWTHPENYITKVLDQTAQRADIRFTLYNISYHLAVGWKDSANFREVSPHRFRLSPDSQDRSLSAVFAFSPAGLSADLPQFEQVLAARTAYQENFWKSVAALDLTGSTNPAADKLEGRVVLSQYLTSIQLAGNVPPQETGLTASSWYGKHHTEMIWWQTAHFALWGRPDLLEKNLTWYLRHLGAAEALAQQRGLRGARWAKMVDPSDRESPGGNALIVWNQPHAIYLSELIYRTSPGRQVLERYKDLVLETADAMASMVNYDSSSGLYILGPPLWIAQEIYDPPTSENPTFELAYWYWAISVAQQWRERLGMPRDESWDDVLKKLSPLPEDDGKYVALQSHPDTWQNVQSRHDHPEMLMAMGLLPPTAVVDRNVMTRTLDAVLKQWDWKTKIWGWDYPMIAMTATRLQRPDLAMEILLRDGPNNRYLPNGHCPQSSDSARPPSGSDAANKPEIAVYLPANGAFLSAVALMVQGWDGCTEQLPGFPKDGSWQVRAEGWRGLP